MEKIENYALGSEDFSDFEDDEDYVDPINDIIEYLVRSAKISFKNPQIHGRELRTNEKILFACELFKHSPTDFLTQFGKYLAPHHVNYFESLICAQDNNYKECVAQLKIYHADECKKTRIKNRRFKALQKLKTETDYFSDKQMMSRNPLLYEQMIGQYLTDDEIRERDGVDKEHLTFLDLVLETVDHNEMREKKNQQMLEEAQGTMAEDDENQNQNDNQVNRKQWGEFETADTKPSFKPEPRKQTMIGAPKRKLLREEFLKEMHNSFLEGKDDIDYDSIDNDEQLDDLQQMSQDAEDRYFDSETNDVHILEEHMALIESYKKKSQSDSEDDDDPLDIYMSHISNKANNI